MKFFKGILLFGLFTLSIAACGSNPTPYLLDFYNPYAPQPGDNYLVPDDIKVASSSVNLSKSEPPQVIVSFAYFPPTPCYQLRVEVVGLSERNHLSLGAYAVGAWDSACTRVPPGTPLQARLNLGNFPRGHYTVLLNGNEIGEFDA